ncbi:MAG: TlpA family protein disulfide reductase [Desulfosarcina sp.]|nr:TlpA family protein disulfide reductase [Desulfobacterales bacterium]
MVILVLALLWCGLVPGRGLAADVDERTAVLMDELGILAVPRLAPPAEIRLPDLNGNMVDLDDFRGKVIFLNFWTTWCPTCQVEMPSMERLYQRFRERDFVMLAVDLQEPVAQVQSFFEQYRLSFTALMDTRGAIGRQFRVRALPTTIIIDKQGAIVGKALGPRKWDSSAAFRLFEHLVERDASGTD